MLDRLNQAMERIERSLDHTSTGPTWRVSRPPRSTTCAVCSGPVRHATVGVHPAPPADPRGRRGTLGGDRRCWRSRSATATARARLSPGRSARCTVWARARPGAPAPRSLPAPDGLPTHRRREQQHALPRSGPAGLHRRGLKTRIPLVHPARTRRSSTSSGASTSRPGGLEGLSDQKPGGVVAVCDDLDPSRAEGTELDYHQAVITSSPAPAPAPAPEGTTTLPVPPGTWAVFTTSGAWPPGPSRSCGATCSPRVPVQPLPDPPGPGDPPHPACPQTARRRTPSCGCRWSGNRPTDTRTHARTPGRSPSDLGFWWSRVRAAGISPQCWPRGRC